MTRELPKPSTSSAHASGGKQASAQYPRLAQKDVTSMPAHAAAQRTPASIELLWAAQAWRVRGRCSTCLGGGAPTTEALATGYWVPYLLPYLLLTS